MNWRLLFGVFTILIAMGIHGYLLATERIADSEKQRRHQTVQEDPLLDISYTSGTRQVNFKAFGLDERQQKLAMKAIGDFQDLHADRLVRMLDQAPELTELADALCGQDKALRPRYSAMRYLVQEKGGERMPVDLRRLSSFKRQEWSYVATVDAVYAEVELRDGRQADATLMGVAAIMAGQEQQVLDHRTPWGRGLAPGTWSFAKVKDRFPGLEERLIDYFAMMQLTVELARGEGGVCEG